MAFVAKSQPHVAYAAFIHGEQHKYTYFLRTIVDISANLQPLDDAIDNILIPALFGCEITGEERKVLSLPVREGGLGVRQVASSANSSYGVSSKVTAPLIKQIMLQADELPSADDVKEAKCTAIHEYKTQQAEANNHIRTSQSPRTQRNLEQLSAPGASSWLGALPLESHGFNLTKSEFHDALAMRYNRQIKNLPEKCPCGEVFDVTHALNCHLGGFINVRHNKIRDFDGSLLKTILNDVECEPPLQPVINKNGYLKTAILTDDARLDIRARGFWREGQNAFFDVRVTNADCASQEDSSIKAVLRSNENEKKRHYNRRVMQVEHGSFTPLVFTTTGVMGHECSIFHKSLAEKISVKKGERYEDIVRYMRVKFSYLALRATLMCLRGSRKLKTKVDTTVSDFGLALNELGI